MDKPDTGHGEQAEPVSRQGLTDQQVAARLRQHGYNELPSKQQRSVLRIVFDVLAEPMFLLLIAAGAIYLMLGDPSDALMLLGFVFVSMGITVLQARKTERVLESLRDLSSPRALVLRNGEQCRIPGREVVPGDLLVLEEGDRVAADGVLLQSHGLLVDESMLTGESVAVAKSAVAPDVAPELGKVHAGCLVAQGSGLVHVQATGAATALGKIGKSLQSLVPERSPLQREIAVLVKRFALFGASLSAMLMLLYGWSSGDWINGLLVSVSLAMSLLPEEFTVILTVFMALGAWRIARHHVLTRHTPVIEALGSATVLCVDKTGTLTQNRMAVKAAVFEHLAVRIDAATGNALGPGIQRLLEVTVLASQAMPFDPMEKAFHRCLEDKFPARKAELAQSELVHTYPISKELMAMTQLWRRPGETQLSVAAKGAPEAIIGLCGLSTGEACVVLEEVQQLAAQGMRVLALASGRWHGRHWPATQAGLSFTWLGLIALADPLRAEVPGAIATCEQAGIRVIMITGDYPATAQAIAKDAGLPHKQVCTGAQLQAMDDAALQQALIDCHVFARILPDQKLRLVTAFKARGEVVAMTGDGVNDAPALKAAHIGISMGARGTDVAREASSLVLLNDDFNSIVQAIELGRRIYANLRKAFSYVVAVHVPIAGIVILPVLLGLPAVFAPIHIVFLELIINPACAIVFETESAEQDSMRKAPRRAGEPLFGARNIAMSLLQGAGLLMAAVGILFVAKHGGMTEGAARALSFAGLVLGNVVLIVSSRSSSTHLLALLLVPNAAQWWLLAGVGGALAIVLQAPALQQMFHFDAVPPRDLVLPIAACVAAAAWCEAVKAGFRRTLATKA